MFLLQREPPTHDCYYTQITVNHASGDHFSIDFKIRNGRSFYYVEEFECECGECGGDDWAYVSERELTEYNSPNIEYFYLVRTHRRDNNTTNTTNNNRS